jgi:hypothetical protein
MALRTDAEVEAIFRAFKLHDESEVFFHNLLAENLFDDSQNDIVVRAQRLADGVRQRFTTLIPTAKAYEVDSELSRFQMLIARCIDFFPPHGTLQDVLIQTMLIMQRFDGPHPVGENKTAQMLLFFA